MSSYFLWGGLTVFVAFPSMIVFQGITFAGLLMIVGLILLILGK
jgi:hypothetical protein